MSAFDVAVVGAGAAGLAAAAELAARGCSVCMLEARERVGGRILTTWAPGIDAPVELGAEFVHGRPAATLSRLAAAGGVIVDAARERWTRRDGGLEPAVDLFDELMRGLESAPRPGQDI